MNFLTTYLVLKFALKWKFEFWQESTQDPDNFLSSKYAFRADGSGVIFVNFLRTQNFENLNNVSDTCLLHFGRNFEFCNRDEYNVALTWNTAPKTLPSQLLNWFSMQFYEWLFTFRTFHKLFSDEIYIILCTILSTFSDTL